MEASDYEKTDLGELMASTAVTPSREGLRLDVRLVSLARLCMPRYTRRASHSLCYVFPSHLREGRVLHEATVFSAKCQSNVRVEASLPGE